MAANAGIAIPAIITALATVAATLFILIDSPSHQGDRFSGPMVNPSDTAEVSVFCTIDTFNIGQASVSVTGGT